ncbi:RDD family protein [Streptomyces polygonati]|uniref:RDD family protein n=1 Tax=Streptomyces polygonati TaxID=1617087 RepID=A0ABV8HZV9_9ACTN
MSAPTSGSAGSSPSASPAPGYYPDPSIPDYIRYWNGSAWVPGTSRPAPAPEGAGGSTGSTAGGGAPALPPPPSASLPAPRSAPAVDESGPMFLDEDPGAPIAEVPGPAWPAVPQEELPRISWGSQDPLGQAPPAAAPPSPAPPAPAPRRVPPQAAAARPQPAPAPSSQPAPQPLPQSSAPWAAQVHDLARQGRPPAGQGGAEAVAPWRPPASDPFGSALNQERPGGLVRRFAARVIDTLVGGAVVGAAAVPLGSAAYHHAKDKVDAARLTGETVKVWLIDGTTGVQLGAVLVVAVAAGLLLEVLPTVKWGRTLGKKLVGLRVLDLEAQLPPGFGASLRRWLTRAVLDLLVIGIVGLAWCLVDRPWRQCWHDKAGRTFVASG